MSILSGLLGDVSGALDKAKRESSAALRRGREGVDSAISRSIAERGAIRNLIMGEIQTQRAISGTKNSLEVEAATASARAQATSSRAAALSAAGATGGTAALGLTAGERIVGDIFSAEQSARLRRSLAASQAIGQLTGTLGQVTSAGLSSELQAETATANREAQVVTNLGTAAVQAESQKGKALLGAIGAVAAASVTGGASLGIGGALSAAGGFLNDKLNFLDPGF